MWRRGYYCNYEREKNIEKRSEGNSPRPLRMVVLLSDLGPSTGIPASWTETRQRFGVAGVVSSHQETRPARGKEEH